MQVIQKIDLKIDKTSKQKTVMYVFQTLFLQMALHLFVDPTVAKDVLTVSSSFFFFCHIRSCETEKYFPSARE